METTIMMDNVIDVTEQTFASEVLERSQTTPVVVDFWAEWCAPCRMLGPTLEKLAKEYNGNFILAKVDVDQNQGLSRQFQVQGIPAVKAFYQGKVAGEFTGALPEPQVRTFLEGLIPSQADHLARQGYDWERGGQLSMAISNYREALAEKPDHYHALVGLGRTLLKEGEVEEALTFLNKIPLGAPERSVAEALIATAELQLEAAGQTAAELLAKLEADPTDVPTRYTLAGLYATEQNFEAALTHFLEVVRRDRTYKDDGARKAMLALFTSIGEDNPLTKDFRRKLANVLF